MAQIEIEGFACEVVKISDFARGPDGYCAFCKGDPIAERSETDSVISRFYAENPRAETCPCCQGRPT